MAGHAFRSSHALEGASAADVVFDEIYRWIVEVRLPPGARLSEMEVARRTGVSRQPVRDAFFRLSRIGLLHIRPQRATTVSLIAEPAVHQARFVRIALETEIVRRAARIGEADLAALADILAEQEAAVDADDRPRFHALDDAFHQAICAACGRGHVWTLIRDVKAQMDRVRWLSLGFSAACALADHRRILDALAARDPDRAAAEMRTHLSRIVGLLDLTRRANPRLFAEPPE